MTPLRIGRLIDTVQWLLGSTWGQILLAVVGIVVLIALALLAMAVRAVRQIRTEPVRPVRIEADEVDAADRSAGERALQVELATEPGWQQAGWLRVADSVVLVATDGTSWAVCQVKDGVAGIRSIHAESDGVEWECAALADASQSMPFEPRAELLQVFGRPGGQLLPLHRAQTSGRPLTPIPDPVARIVERADHDHRQAFTGPGRYVDADGCGRFTLSGAVTGVRDAPGGSAARVERAHKRADAVLQSAARATLPQQSTPPQGRPVSPSLSKQPRG